MALRCRSAWTSWRVSPLSPPKWPTTIRRSESDRADAVSASSSRTAAMPGPDVYDLRGKLTANAVAAMMNGIERHTVS